MLSIEQSRRSDRLLGRALCGVVERVRRPARPVPDPASVRRILVVKVWGMGSLLLATPLFRNLRRACPRAEIHVLTLPEHAVLFENSSLVDRVRPFDRSTAVTAGRSGLRVLREPWDLLIDLEVASHGTAAGSALSRARFTVGFAPPGTHKRVYDAIAPWDEGAHVRRLYLGAAAVMGWPCEDGPLEAPYVGTADRAAADRFLARAGIRDFVAFNPNASELARERLWALDRWIELGRAIRDRHRSLGIVVIGGPTDRTRCEPVARGIGAADAGGALSIPGTAALLGRAHALVSNDSGPLHLGVAVGVPTVGLYGPESPVRYGPPPPHAALWSGEPCSPCLREADGKRVRCERAAACMGAIEVADVLVEVERRLHQSILRGPLRSSGHDPIPVA